MDDLTLPIGKLQEWTDELRRIETEVARLTASREEILQKVHAVRLLFGPGAVADPEPTPADKTDLTFVDFVSSCVDQAEAGLTLPEIAEQLKNSPLRERYKNNPNALYTAVARLVSRERMVREGRLVYSPSAFERVKAGVVQDRTKTVGEPAMSDLILAAVAAAGKGLTSGEILDAVRKDESAAARLAVHTQIGYNAISRLMKKGKLNKSGKLYMLPGSSLPDNAGEDGSLF